MLVLSRRKTPRSHSRPCLGRLPRLGNNSTGAQPRATCRFSLFVRRGLDLSAESTNPLIMLRAATRSDDEVHQRAGGDLELDSRTQMRVNSPLRARQT